MPTSLPDPTILLRIRDLDQAKAFLRGFVPADKQAILDTLRRRDDGAFVVEFHGLEIVVSLSVGPAG